MSTERIVFLDTETTGLSPTKGGHRVIEIACIEYIGEIATGNVFNTQINPEGKKSTKGAFKTHGISDASLADKQTFSFYADKILQFLKGTKLVIFNADFDVDFLESEFKRVGHKISIEHHCSEIICAMKLANEVLQTNSTSLNRACLRYKIDITARTIHSAHIDTELLAELYFKLIDLDASPLDRTPHTKQRRKAKAIPIPCAYKDPVTEEYVQLNYCKNASCQNYRIPAKNPSRNPDGIPKRGLGNDYKLTYTKNARTYLLTCKHCSRSSILINNRAYVEERNRVLDRLFVAQPACTNTGLPADKSIGRPKGIKYRKVKIEDPTTGKVTTVNEVKPACENAGLGIYSHPELYKMDGHNSQPKNWAETYKKSVIPKGNPTTQVELTTKIPSLRYQCKTCKTKFSVKQDPQQKHYLRHVNEPMFLALVNKNVINRILEKFSRNPKTVYDKLDFIYQQCIYFDKRCQYALKKILALQPLRLSTDRQMYLSNWGDHNMPMTTHMINTSTVDNDSGFVLASTMNFDFSSDYEFINSENILQKDSEKEIQYRRYSQYILNNNEIDNGEDNWVDVPVQRPAKGLLVKQTYSILAHFHEVNKLIEKAPHVVLYADRDTAFESVIPAVFSGKISRGEFHAFQIAAKGSNQKSPLSEETKNELAAALAELKKKHPDKCSGELREMLWHRH